MKTEHSVEAAAAVVPCWVQPVDEVLAGVSATESGLSSAQASERLAELRASDGKRHQSGWLRILIRQFTSPIVLILVFATVISMVVGEVTEGAVILAIVLASGLLGFAQDLRAGKAVAALMARVQVSANVVRDDAVVPVPVADVVRGDIVVLTAGSVVPADCRLITSNELLIDESVLTGESFPVEKNADAVVAASAPIPDRLNTVFQGTHVASGTARAVAVQIGKDSVFGQVSTDLNVQDPVTAYEKGITQFGYLLVRLMIVLSAFIFLVNAISGRHLIESLLFSLALAVGLTPQMLPAIVTLSLTAGARRMAQRRVVVKRLDAIEDFGSMSVLCTDKTGTLTEGSPQIDLAIDLNGEDSAAVGQFAALNAGLQAGFANPMDVAILAKYDVPTNAELLGEIPYDFSRKRLSVATVVDGQHLLIVKGAFDGVLACSSHAQFDGQTVTIEQVEKQIRGRYEELSARGFRVLGIATRNLPGETHLDPDLEQDLTLIGMLAFHDPVKPTARDAVAQLQSMGVSLRLITGDNALVAQATAKQVGLPSDRILTGREIAGLSDEALPAAIAQVDVFAEMEPHTKQRLVRAFRTTGAGVGFLGDGINDAPALHAADVGISVDTAVDVAKEAASIVLLDKDLGAVIDGVRLGRTTFANTRKYIRLTTSANFGNMVSMAVASTFLPFLPLLPLQILLLNFLSDIPSLSIAADQVDAEQTDKPATWDLVDMRRYLFVFGGVSAVFDLVTFGVLLLILQVGIDEFRSAWFIESTISELLVLFSLRTTRPMFRSRPARTLVLLSLIVGTVVTVIPFIPLIAKPLGLIALTWPVFLAVMLISVTYVATNEITKRIYVRKRDRRRALSRLIETSSAA